MQSRNQARDPQCSFPQGSGEGKGARGVSMMEVEGRLFPSKLLKNLSGLVIPSAARNLDLR
jgi:hypothetical protein